MKFILTCVIFISPFLSSAQTIYTSKKDISAAEEIIFYGYDFSNFKLTDIKSFYGALNKDPVGINDLPTNRIRKYISAWVGYLLNRKDERYFAKHLKTSKITFDFDYTFSVIKQLSDSNVISQSVTIIPVDTIQSIINNYQINQKQGIGFTIIVECFNKSKESSSAYFTFFDIASKKVLMSDYFKTNYAEGIGLTNHWGSGFNYTVNSYVTNEFKSNVKSKKR